MRVHPILGVACVALTVASARTQEQQVPKELALALISPRGGDGGDIVVGQMPPDLASVFTLPPGGRVLGSFLGVSYVQVAMTLPGSTDSALAFARRSLVAHGWAPPQPPMPRMGGLQYGVSRSALPTMFCKPDSPEGVSITADFHGPSTALLRLTKNSAMGICEQLSRGSSPSSLERVGFFDMKTRESPMESVPPLWAPGDANAAIICRDQTFNSASSSGQRQEVHTDLSTQAVLDHFGRQMDSAGWKPLGASGSTLASTWTQTMPDGGLHEVTITVSKNPAQPGCYTVELRAELRRNTR